MIIEGGCLCGACRFEISEPLGPANYCHCIDCRRSTGSAFNIGVRVARVAFQMRRGTPKTFTKTADSGNVLSRAFCGDCGSPLYTASPHHPDWVFVKAGVLDSHAGLVPSHESWTKSEVPWARIPAGLTRYDGGRV